MHSCEILLKSGKCGLPGACLALALLCLLNACEGDPKPRVYSEVAFKENPAPAAGRGGMGMGALPPTNASPVDIKVTWTLPETWMIRDSANAMRVGSFAVPDSSLAYMGEADPNALDVSVVQLAGEAGGLEANILRWMGQVGLIATPDELKALVASAEKLKVKTGQEGIFVDFTERLSGDMTRSKSIFGAIVMNKEYTVFVKAMGERERLVRHKPEIVDFCKSLQIQGPEA